MAKLAAYLGPPVPVASLLEVGTASLLRQAESQPDGFGLGWYPLDEAPEPLTASSASPPWIESEILEIARRYQTTCAIVGLRKVRPADRDAPPRAQPLRHGRHLFLHDGELARFRDVYERPLRARLRDRAHRVIQGPTAPEILFATWLDALGNGEGPEAMASALEMTAGVVQELAVSREAPATFAVVVSDGMSLVTLRTATHGAPPPMYTIVAGPGMPFPEEGRVIASEPLFEGGWSALDTHSLVIFAGEENQER